MSERNLQEDFLKKLQQGRKPVTIITANGFQMKGNIIAYDQFTLLVEIAGRQNLVYKSAISTIVEEV